MKYTVLWARPAEQELAAIWTRATDRARITSAANSIDIVLSEDAQEQGESREGTLRILFAPPLGVEFDVVEEDRIVHVLAVWSFA